jgi:hypothetical protein
MLHPRIKAVEPQGGLLLRVTFETGEVRGFDVEPFIISDFFEALRDPAYFRRVSVVPGGGGIEWPNEQDFSRDTVYLKSVRVDETAPA